MLVNLFVTQKAKLKKRTTPEILEKKSQRGFQKKCHTGDFGKKKSRSGILVKILN